MRTCPSLPRKFLLSQRSPNYWHCNCVAARSAPKPCCLDSPSTTDLLPGLTPDLPHSSGFAMWSQSLGWLSKHRIPTYPDPGLLTELSDSLSMRSVPFPAPLQSSGPSLPFLHRAVHRCDSLITISLEWLAHLLLCQSTLGSAHFLTRCSLNPHLPLLQRDLLQLQDLSFILFKMYWLVLKTAQSICIIS